MYEKFATLIFYNQTANTYDENIQGCVLTNVKIYKISKVLRFI